MKARDVIKRALQLLGEVGATQTPSAEDVSLGLEVLNEWIDKLALESTNLFYVGRNVHNLAASTASYTIGTGGAFNQVRPVHIEAVSIIPDGGAADPTEIPLGRPLNLEDYQRLSMKTATGGWPTTVYYDHNWAAGLGTIFVHPVPTSNAPDIVLYTPQALAEFADLDTDYTFPPGYRRAIRYNLAVELAEHFDGALVSPRIERVAIESMAEIKRANYRPTTLGLDPALLGYAGRWNIQTGGY